MHFIMHAFAFPWHCSTVPKPIFDVCSIPIQPHRRLYWWLQEKMPDGRIKCRIYRNIQVVNQSQLYASILLFLIFSWSHLYYFFQTRNSIMRLTRTRRGPTLVYGSSFGVMMTVRRRLHGEAAAVETLCVYEGPNKVVPTFRGGWLDGTSRCTLVHELLQKRNAQHFVHFLFLEWKMELCWPCWMIINRHFRGIFSSKSKWSRKI
jgi:hypothetical protein